MGERKNAVRPAALTQKQRIRAGIHTVLTKRLAREIIAIVNGDSKAISDKELAHKQARVNRGKSEDLHI
ncbi:hypothetical protein EV424DRAFT_1384626 [Suillus variegatus]|nr:hypothetical protein EV424DRAFT_1384626 [Suillus variegatus]